MKVILTTTIKKLGKIGDIVSVKPGYARNFLFPNNMALRENKKNKDVKLREAKDLLEGIKKIKISFNREADEKDQLYGSISKKEIIDYLLDNKLKVKSDDLLIKNQIKSIGEHIIEINPYENIVEEFTIQVNKN